MRLGSFFVRKFAKPGSRPKQNRRRRLKTSTRSTLPAVLVRKPRASAQVLSSVVENLEITEGKSSLLASELLRPGDQLRQSIEAFLLDQRSENTRRAYGKDLKRFLKFLVYKGAQSHAPDTINRSLLIAFKEHLLSEKLEHVTVDRHLASLRSFFRWLVDDGLIKVNPAAGVRFLNPKRISKTNGFSDEEVVKILGLQPLHSRTGAMHHAILCLLFYCGLRRSELCGLRTTSLGVERSHPVLRLQGKGNKERMIPLVPPVQKAISHYLKITGKSPDRDAYLFSPIRNNRTSEKDKPLDPSMIFYLVTKYAKQAGVKNRVSPHSCRATAISNARDHQVSDRAIQEFAGWSSPDMITRYDKRKTSILQSAAHVIDYLPKK